MRFVANILIDSIKLNKAYFLFLLILVVGCSFYAVFGHSQITAMYEGKSFNVLNNLIQYQHKHSLEHYLDLADFLFIRMLFLLFSLGSFVYLLCLLVFFARKVSLFWPILLFTSTLILVYALNPNNRVYSYHGFYRAGIVYQILNGYIPPPDFLFAGEPLRSPWGYPFLTVCVVHIFQITPFYAFALLNIISLILVCWLLYKISQTILRDPRANVFSVLISIFGISIFSPNLVSILSRLLQFDLEFRATPAFQKFFNVNGVPVGLVFYFSFLFSIVRIFENKKVVCSALYLGAATLGCGFFYLPMLPGMLAGAGAICVLLPVLGKYNFITVGYRRIVLIAAILFICLLMLIPYWRTTSAGIHGGIRLFDIGYVMRNFMTYVILIFPILTVILINRDFHKNLLNKLPLLLVSIFIAANALSYVFIHIPDYAEYKLLILSTTALGILGGISFRFMLQERKKIAVFILLLLFFYPSAEVVYNSLTHHASTHNLYQEKGIYLHSLDREEDELYEWIRQHTPMDCVFLDSEPTIPIYAQRRLFIGIDKEDWGTTGYGVPIDYLLTERHGYTMEAIEKRRRIVEEIYHATDSATATEVKYLFDEFEPVYIVTRDHTTLPTFSFMVFEERFRSHNGKYHVYQGTFIP